MTDAVHPRGRAATDLSSSEPSAGAPPGDHRLLPTPWSRAAAVALALVTVLHLMGQLVDGPTLERTTQWFLMPLLAAVLWSATRAPRPRLVRLVLLALGFSWVGDTLPDLFDGDAAFLAMVGGFLVAQVVYAVAFWPHRGASLLRTPWVAVYAVAAVVLVGACAPGAPTVLLAAVVVYAVCLVTTAVLATGVHRLAGIGGVVFLVSDSLIGLGAFAEWYALPLSGFWVMLTYVVGQALLVAGVLSRGAAEPAGAAQEPRRTSHGAGSSSGTKPSRS
ncbi:lysoplasmalogenase [Isoptericola sp. NEAU-Y5]|uniref:Lysoplasmalogenase n=1 Tax=Isoptericola luteus TaxID=2879484 RepID=A0ABS7ZJE2_9MICO|nr:lysoplasmalogenase [Isoptericola sp. NEAU-Y5]MCA5893900.1 lysoplasmalogenase [Isoptericola sp. NEAU-Y5]